MGGWAVAAWAVIWGWRRLAAEQVWCSRTSWETLQPLNPSGIIDTDLRGGAGRKADHSSFLKILSKRQKCGHAVALSEPIILREFWIRECCEVWVGQYPGICHLLGHWWQSYIKQRYHGEAAWPGESGLMVSSQAAVESCHRNWLAVPQACSLSSLLWKTPQDKKYMASCVKPWREQGTLALPRETEDSAVPSRAQPEWCALGWARSACPAPGPQTLGVLI